MSRKHTIDCGNQLWDAVKRFQLDFHTGTINNTVLLLLCHGLEVAPEIYLAEKPTLPKVVIPLQNVENIPAISASPQVAAATVTPPEIPITPRPGRPKKHDSWSPAHLAKIQADLKSKHGEP